MTWIAIFFFPHTTVIDGMIIENISLCGGSAWNSKFRCSRVSTDILKENIDRLKIHSSSLLSLLKHYSFTSSVLLGLMKQMDVRLEKGCKMTTNADLFRMGERYIASEFTRPNRQVITYWVEH